MKKKPLAMCNNITEKISLKRIVANVSLHFLKVRRVYSVFCVKI